MTEFKHILFPVDFSPNCYACIPAVKEMIGKCKAKLTLLHVVEIPLSWYGSMSSAVPEEWDMLETAFQAGGKRLTDFAKDHFADLDAERRLESFCDKGDPANAILALAEEARPDLIMMPTHGYGPFRNFVLGSVTTRVLHRAPCPLWTFAHSETTAKEPAIRKILCGVDLKTQRVDLIQSAVELGRTFSAEVELVSAVPPQAGGPVAPLAADFDRYMAEGAAGELAGLQQKANTNLKSHVKNGPVDEVVKAVATEDSADLIVIGRGSVQKALGRLTSHAYGIIRNAPCPVLSL
jgi:nucleotide-binding universal stress UspA family protein